MYVCMKVNKTITIDDDLKALLDKEDNSSKLICDLLREHFDKKAKDNMTLEEMEKEVKRLELEAEYERRREALRDESKD